MDDLTLTAHWIANTYTVQYRGQSSLHTLLPDVTYSTQLCTYDVPFTMPGRPQSISLNPRKTKRRHQACENEKSSVHNLKSVMNTRYGAGDRDRTGTPFPARDFKSRASASSATPAHMPREISRFRGDPFI